MPVIANLTASELLSSDGATVTSLTADDIVQTALAANPARRGGFLYNDADKDCYVKLGSGASATSFTARLAKKDAGNIGGSLNLGTLRVYRGVITVLWETSPTGSLRIT